MQFRNLTPFASMCFAALDPAGAEHRVVVMKVAYRLQRRSSGFVALVNDEAPVALCTADEYFGDPGQGSVRRESDLAPYKPRCDLLINGKAYAPGGEPSGRWTARVRLTAPDRGAPLPDPPVPLPLSPGMPLTTAQRQAWELEKKRVQRRRKADAERPYRVLLDKSLSVSGPSEFRGNLLAPGWHRSRPEPATQVDLQWENAFGGRCKVPEPKSPDGPAMFDEVCFSNPIGTGWLDSRWFAALRKARLKQPTKIRAPQIEYPGAELSAPIAVRHPKGPLDAPDMARTAARYGAKPAGFGAVGRAWAPRLELAGTYDEQWLRKAHPLPPNDMDFSYWNCAPDDQQTEFLPLGVRLELWNLMPPEQCPSGYVAVDVPQHRAFVLARLHTGVMLPLPMLTDTIEVDSVTGVFALTHRISIKAGTPVRVLEARFETDTAEPLVKRNPEAFAEVAHG